MEWWGSRPFDTGTIAHRFWFLDLGMGVAVWFREDSGPTENEVAWQHTEFALRLVGARDF